MLLVNTKFVLTEKCATDFASHSSTAVDIAIAAFNVAVIAFSASDLLEFVVGLS